MFLQDSVRVDPVRVVEAVTAGVAFLAAGSILFSKGEIHGLTTGAGMWLSGAIGVACGLDLWQVAALGTLLVLVVAGLLYSFAAKSGIGENTGQGKPISPEDVSKPRKG
jgi:putative Mg2+ transporter-C (MgtC) family protein